MTEELFHIEVEEKNKEWKGSGKWDRYGDNYMDTFYNKEEAFKIAQSFTVPCRVVRFVRERIVGEWSPFVREV